MRTLRYLKATLICGAATALLAAPQINVALRYRKVLIVYHVPFAARNSRDARDG